MRQTRRHPRDVDGKAFISQRNRPQRAQLVSEKYGTQANRKKAPYSQVNDPQNQRKRPKKMTNEPREKKDPYSLVKESPEATETALRNLVVRIRGTLGILYVHL